MKIIGYIQSPFTEKFGVPRQSGLCRLRSHLHFEKSFRVGLKGIEKFSHIWVVFGFHKISQEKLMVRPPRLGGKTKVGVLATRSPHRPNHLGLSLVRIEKVQGQVLTVIGLDAVNESPIYDIKPFVPEDQPKGELRWGWTEGIPDLRSRIYVPTSWHKDLPEQIIRDLKEVLRIETRPAPQRGKDKVFGLCLHGYNFRYNVQLRENHLKISLIEFHCLESRVFQ